MFAELDSQGQEPSSYADLLQKVKEITALGKPMALPYLQLLNNAPLKTLTSMVSDVPSASRPALTTLVYSSLRPGATCRKRSS